MSLGTPEVITIAGILGGGGFAWMGYVHRQIDNLKECDKKQAIAIAEMNSKLDMLLDHFGIEGKEE